MVWFLGGGLDDFLDWVGVACAGCGVYGWAPTGAPATGAPAMGAPAAGAPKPSAADERPARKELQRLERQLDRLSTREAELTAQLAAHATDYEMLTALGAELRATQAEKSALEERVLTVAAELEHCSGRATEPPP